MAKLLWFAVIALILGYLIYVSAEGNINPASLAQDDINKLRKIITDQKCFATGDCITINHAPPPPIVEREEQVFESVPTNNTNSTNSTVPLITRTTMDARCFGDPSNPYNPCEPGIADRVQIGNQVIISGNIKMVDPYTTIDPQNPSLVPAPFKYSLEIFCDFRDFCITDPIAVRDKTDTIGNFKYKWTTTPTNSNEGEYIAKITSWSETLDPLGRPYLLEHEYRFVLVT